MTQQEMTEERLQEVLEEMGKNVQETGSINPKEMTQEDAQLFYSLGHRLYQSGDYAKAEPLFRKLAVGRPMEVRNWMGLAASLQEQAKYEEATVAWTMVCFFNNEDPMPHFHAAECLVSLYKFEDAVEALDTVCSLANNDQTILNKVAALKSAIASRLTGEHLCHLEN